MVYVIILMSYKSNFLIIFLIFLYYLFCEEIDPLRFGLNTPNPIAFKFHHMSFSFASGSKNININKLATTSWQYKTIVQSLACLTISSYDTKEDLFLTHIPSFICSTRPNQSHPLQTCTTQASLHIAASFPSMQGLHPATEKAACPTTKMKKSITIPTPHFLSKPLSAQVG